MLVHVRRLFQKLWSGKCEEMIVELAIGGVGFTVMGLLMIFLDYMHGIFPYFVFWTGILMLLYLLINLINVLYIEDTPTN